MNINELEWVPRGCCGEHEVASFDDAAGRRITIDKSGGAYVVTIMRDEFCVEPPPVLADMAAVEQWLTERNALPA